MLCYLEMLYQIQYLKIIYSYDANVYGIVFNQKDE